MSLKEQIAGDLEDGAVWFNENEFADWHNVNGANVLCELGAMRSKPEKIGRLRGGALSGSSYLLIRSKDFKRRPKPDEPIYIDEQRYRIINVMDDIGAYVIEYGRYEDAELRRSDS